MVLWCGVVVWCSVVLWRGVVCGVAVRRDGEAWSCGVECGAV